VTVIYTSDFRQTGVSGVQSAESSGMVSGMTPTLPSPMTGPPVSPAPATGSPEGGVAAAVWFLAACHRCNIDGLEEPFLDEGARDDWAARHVETAGHVVFVSTDGSHLPTRVIRRDSDGCYKFLCVAPKCVRWVGPFDSAPIALASARSHTCPVQR
jgi:hypothetical protein